MSDDIINKPGFNVQSLDDMADMIAGGLTQSQQTAPTLSGGSPLIRLLKRGAWVVGQNDETFAPSTPWLVAVLTMQHGWSCWTNYEPGKKNDLIDEKMSPAFGPLMPQPADTPAGWKYKVQRQVEMKALDGSMPQVLYKTTSDGGLKAMVGLGQKIVARIREEKVKKLQAEAMGIDYQMRFCPILTLGADSYKHQAYGETWYPVFTVIGWADQDGGTGAPPTGEPMSAAVQAGAVVR